MDFFLGGGFHTFFRKRNKLMIEAARNASLLGPPTDEARLERENKSGLTPAASTGQWIYLASNNGCQNM